MAKQIINIGVSANDKSGDPLRTAAQKINNNFGELYLYLGNGTELTVATVAKTGSYNSLVDKPNMALYQLKTESFSGRYDDLSGRPTSWDWNFITGKPDLSQFQTKSEAFSGNYSDLTNRPDLSIYQLKSQTFSGNYADLTNKPTLFSGSYADLTNKPTLATVATSGSYNDLTNKPAVFSGSYSDLTNKPTIPVDVSDLTDTQGLLEGYGIPFDAGSSATVYALSDISIDGGSASASFTSTDLALNGGGA